MKVRWPNPQSSAGGIAGASRAYRGAPVHNRQSVNVERATITSENADSVTFRNVPIPPSVNNLFFNLPSGGRAKTKQYNTWRAEAAICIRAQHPKMVKGRVSLHYIIEHGGSRADLGNLEKPSTDLLVDLGIIEGDSPKHVRELHMQFGHEPGLTIEVRRL